MSTPVADTAPRVSPELAARIDAIFDSQLAHRYTVMGTTVTERRAKLRRLLDSVYAHREHLKDALYKDFHKPSAEVDMTETVVATAEIKHTIRHLRRWMKPQRVRPTLATLTTHSAIHYQPKGVVLIMGPWNYPFHLLINPLASAIAAGNCAILKPSEFTPHTTSIIQSIVRDVFTPEEVAVVEGGVEVAQYLMTKPFHHVFFTGSPRVGRQVMAAAARNLTSVTLELGGKSPLILDDSASFQDAADKIAWGKFSNNGQTCIAPDYLLVPESRRDAFVEQLKDAINHRLGPLESLPDSPDYARIITDAQFERLSGLVEDAVNGGARVVYGGQQDPARRYMAPTLLVDVPQASRIMKEEIFGPLLPILTYRSLDDAIAFINGGDKPLALYLFASRRAVTRKVLSETQFGGGCINDIFLHYFHANLPFGGDTTSGFGKSHGFFGFQAFSNARGILHHHRFNPVKLMYPPYTRFSRWLIDLGVRYL